MITRLRNSIFIKVFWGLLSLHLLNISVDIADPRPAHLPEDLSFNDQESIVEIVVEKILGFEEAIKEYDDHDTQEDSKKKNLKIDLVSLESLHQESAYRMIKETNLVHTLYTARLSSGYENTDKPPPKI